MSGANQGGETSSSRIIKLVLAMDVTKTSLTNCNSPGTRDSDLAVVGGLWLELGNLKRSVGGVLESRLTETAAVDVVVELSVTLEELAVNETISQLKLILQWEGLFYL